MKIEKGGISREIDERNFSEYKEKGYAAVSAAESETEISEKPLEEFTLKELKEFAKLNGIDIGGAKTKDEVLQKLMTWFEENKLPEREDENAGEA